MENRRINYLKALAILFIIITHNPYTPALRKSLYFPFWIDLAVPIFMMITGYTYSLSPNRWSEREVLERWYSKENLKKKLLRILPSYVLVYLLELWGYNFAQRPLPFNEKVLGFFTGGWGPGAYYVMFVFVLIFIFPFLYLPLRRNPKKGLLLILALHLLWDIFAEVMVPYEAYRVIILRVIAFIALGIWLYLDKEKPAWVLPVALIFSLLFIYFRLLPGDRLFLFNKWPKTALPVAGLPLGLVYWGIKGKIGSKVTWDPINLVGKASWHIFLVQMLYFFLQGRLDEWTKGLLNIQVPLSLAVCLLGGVLFYLAEGKLREWFHGIRVERVRSE